MKREQLIEEVLPYLVTYLQEGTLNIAPLLAELPHVEQLKSLLTVYVLRQQKVIDFMQLLPQTLRQMNTHMHYATSWHIGEVRGEILWEPTIQAQITATKRHYVTSEAEKSWDTEANQLLKAVVEALLQMINHRYIAQLRERTWLQQLYQYMHHLTEASEHIYFSRVQRQKLSTRTIAKLKQHRKKIYRLAAIIYEQLQALQHQQLQTEVLTVALREFFIVPQHSETLFELYWVVQILKQQQDATFFVNDGNTRPLASWQTATTTATLYHNRTGSSRLQFLTHIDELQGQQPFVEASRQQALQMNEVAAQFFKRPRTPYIWRGRPDFIIEYVDEQQALTAVVIGEVKYTNDPRYMQQGLAELLHYMHHVKLEGTPQLYGVLCVNEYDAQQHHNIQIVSTTSAARIRLPNC